MHAAHATVTRRRDKIESLQPIELQARQLMIDIEALGTDPALTDCSTIAQELRSQLADWIDAGCPGAAGKAP